jgi:hypothetical protein
MSEELHHPPQHSHHTIASFKNLAFAAFIIIMGIVPLAIFGLCILLGLLFKFIDLTFF